MQMTRPPSVTARLAGICLRKVSADDRRRAALHVLDWAGCAIAGGAAEPGRVLADLGAGRSRGAVSRDRRRPAHAVDRGARERRGRQRARDGRRAPDRDPPSGAGGDSRGARRRGAPGRFERGFSRCGGARLRGDDPGGHGSRARDTTSTGTTPRPADRSAPPPRRARFSAWRRKAGSTRSATPARRPAACGRCGTSRSCRSSCTTAAPRTPGCSPPISRASALPDRRRSSKGRRVSSRRCARARTRTTSSGIRSSAGSSTR